uniref:Uncharacterized protein n=1 Tax=Anopheles culicifacies TaxID=139723 RepID=A0A182MI36_9DIPT
MATPPLLTAFASHRCRSSSIAARTARCLSLRASSRTCASSCSCVPMSIMSGFSIFSKLVSDGDRSILVAISLNRQRKDSSSVRTTLPGLGSISASNSSSCELLERSDEEVRVKIPLRSLRPPSSELGTYKGQRPSRFAVTTPTPDEAFSSGMAG